MDHVGLLWDIRNRIEGCGDLSSETKKPARLAALDWAIAQAARKYERLRDTEEWRSFMADASDLESDSRFFIDHGMVHDRKTGKHLVGFDYAGETAEALLSVLRELEQAAKPKAPDLGRTAHNADGKCRCGYCEYSRAFRTYLATGRPPLDW